MSTAFHGIDELVVTFAAGTVTAGYPAAMNHNVHDTPKSKKILESQKDL